MPRFDLFISENIKAKYSSSVGGLRLKYLEVVFPYRQVNAFLRRAQTTYNFPIELRPVLKFFFEVLKFEVLDYVSNNHSTETLKPDIHLLNSSICGVITPFLKGAIRLTLRG